MKEEQITFLVINLAIVVVGFGLSLFFIRKWITDLSKDVRDIDKKRQKCREELPEKYSSKPHSERIFSEIWAKIDELSVAAAKMAGRINGGS